MTIHPSSRAAILLLALSACSRGPAPVVPASPPDPLAAAKAALVRPDLVGFSGRFAAWLLTLDKENIAPARAAVAQGIRDDRLPDRHAEEALDWLDRRWAELDPTGFLDACDRREENYSLDVQIAVLRDLFAKDRHAALQRFLTSPLREAPVRAGNFIWEIAALDPPGMIGYCRGLPEWDDPMAMVPTNIYLQWAGKDSMAAWRAVQAETNPVVRKQIGMNLLHQTIRGQPGLAADWLQATPLATERAELYTHLALNMIGNGKDPLDVVRAWNSPEAWRLWAENKPYEIQAADWVRRIVAAAPKDRCTGCLLAFFSKEDIAIPAVGQPSNLIFASIGDVAIQDKLRAAAHGNPAIAKAEPPKLPLPDAASIDDAYFGDGSSSFHWLARKHDASESDWERQVFQRNPQRALEWIATCGDPHARNSDAGTLAAIWPVEKLGADTLRLLALPDAGHRVVGVAFAWKWIAVDPKAALRALADLPADPARNIFGQSGVLDAGSRQLKNRTELLPMLEAIKDPVARGMALGQVTRNDPPKQAPDIALAEILAMPPSSGRKAAITTFAARIRPGGPIAADKILGMILAIDAKDFADVRDSLLVAATGELLAASPPDIDLALRACAGITAVDVRAKMLTGSRFTTSCRGREPAVLAQLACLPAGMDRDTDITTLCVALAIHDPAAVLALARQSAHPHLRVALLNALLKQGGSKEILAQAKDFAAKFPAEWKSEEWEIAMATREAMEDPRAWWQAHAHEGFDSQKNRSGAFTALQAWMTNDARSAYAAWLATGPDPQLRALSMTFAERVVLTDVLAGRDVPELMLPGSADLLDSLLKHWSKKDPAAATRFCLRVDPVARRHKYFREPFSSWLHKDPDAASAWAISLPVGEDSRALLQLCLDPIDWNTPVAGEIKDMLLDTAVRDPDAIHCLPEEMQKAARTLIDGATREFRETRTSMATMRKIDPAGAEAAYKDLPAGAQKSAARLGLLDAALARADKAGIDTLWREIDADKDMREQVEASLALAGATMKTAPDTLPAVLAGIPWPDARRVATRHMIDLILAGEKPARALAIARAFPDANHRHAAVARVTLGRGPEELTREELERIAGLARSIEDRARRIDALLAKEHDGKEEK